MKRLFNFRSASSLKNQIIIVSGLPRSGTSLMMQLLAAGGLPLLTDHQRQADINNPKGYYEFERAKGLDKGDIDWLPEAKGRGVKVISALLRHLPADYRYRVIFMRRDIHEIMRSQKAMLGELGKEADNTDPEQLAWSLEQHLYDITAWLNDRPHLSVLYVNHRDAINDTARVIRDLNRFLDNQLQTSGMLSVVDPSLYRQRKSP